MQVINDQYNDESGVNPQIKSTFDLLEKGEQEILLDDNYKDVALVLGNIGAGKTAFTQWIAGDNDKLIAKEVVKGSGEFVIEDNNRIGNSTVKFKTIFPELEIDAKTNTAYYDCPGFGNTRSTSNDISATYFIKKVIDHAERVKLIFTINYPSVRKGVDPQDFLKLLKHAIDLIKDIDKLKNSIAIVVTKVDNYYVKIGTNFLLVDDDKILLAITDFLNEVKRDMEDNIKASNIPDNGQKFYDSAIKFIDAILVKDGDYFTKIGIFRRPDESGALSNITLLQEGKEHIKKILHENLNFTEKVAEVFGYTISEKSKNDINDLVEEINTSIWSNVSSISENVLKYFHDLVEQMCDKIRSFIISDTIIDAQHLEAQAFLSKFNQGYNITSNLVHELSNLTNPIDLAGKFNYYISNLEVSMFRENILGVEKFGKCFNLLQVVSDRALRTRPWADLFNGIVTHFLKLRENIDNDVFDVAQKINKRLNDTAEIIRRLYYKKMKSLEIQQLSTELREEQDVMLTMEKEIKSAVTLQELLKTVQIIEGSLNRLGVSIAKKNIQIIVNLEHYFNFLQVVSGKKLVSKTLTWICPLKNAIDFLNQSEKWYDFLSSLFLKFSDYKIQRDRGKYNVAYLEEWGVEGRLQGIKINENNFQKFLSKIAKFNVVEYDNIKNNFVTELRLEELNHVLNLTLKHRTKINCTEPYISIKGSYIRFDDTITSIFRLTNNMDVDIDDSCKNLTVLKSERFNAVKVFALNTLFIDSSIPSVRNNITLILIAPKWEVIGNQVISLDGLKGVSYHNSTMQKNEDFRVSVLSEKSKAKDGACAGASGADGKPGGPGGPGGFFFGIAEQFVNGENLTITVNGGMGGSGQDGGDGFKGTYGVSPILQTVLNIQCSTTFCDEIHKTIGGFYCKKNWCTSPSLKFECEYKIFGKPGEKGGSGGHGGEGGKGGNPGNVVLFEINGKSKITKRVDAGKDGQNGKDGISGISNDDYYQDIVVKCKNEWWFGTTYNNWYLLETIRKKREFSAPRCFNVNDVNNVTAVERPTLETTIEGLEKAKIVNEYKSYLRENSNNRYTDFFLNKFFKKLENNQDIKAVYNTLGLVDELQSLEEHFHKIGKDVDLLPFYLSLLDRIKEYAHNPKEVGDLNQYRKVLSYLYTSTLSRIYNLQDNFESNLIGNISLYLNVAQEDISSLKDLKKAKNKLDIITKYKQDYRSRMDIKIKEAKDLILEQITPEIDGISTEIDNKIELLINEVIALQEQAKEEQKLLNERKQQLKAELLLHGLFSYFKILGQVLGFLGPVGEIAGSVIDIGSTVAESFALDGEHSSLQSAGIVSDLEISQSQIKTIQNQKVTLLRKTLEDLSQEIDKNPEKLGKLSLKVGDIKIKLSKIDDSRYNFNEIQGLENELKLSLQTQEDELRKTELSPKTTNALMVIHFCKKAFQLPSVMHDTYSKYRSNQAQLDTLNKAIDSNENRFQELKEFEEAIYSSIAPILGKVKSDLDRIASQLDTKSKVTLDITKWQVQSTLEEVELKMAEITNSFHIKDEINLMHCIIKMRDAMNILINSYNHIQDYQEDQNFANYVANVCSVTANDIDLVVNPELGTALKNAITDLEITIKSSIVLQRYKVAIGAFKQFVFPFAHIYLKGLLLPSHLEFIAADKKDIPLDILVYEATKRISEIKSKLEQYKGSLTERDGAIGVGEFSNHYVSSEPFFVWENSEYRSEITKLLSGQEVVLKADIINSLPDEDAIKFNSIELNFHLKNETAQSEMNNILTGFKISMTHLGNSYYRYNSKIYQITTNSQDFWYYFERSNSSEPVRRSISYDKLKNFDFMLSPYALWKIRLIDLKINKNNVTFKDLEIFKNETNLELGGKGYFVNKGGIKEDLMMESYYKAIDKHVLNLDENNEKLGTVSLLPDNVFSRNKREVDQKSEQDLEAVNLDHRVSSAHQANKETENSNTKSNGWFSWFQLPSFNFLPVADAAVTEGRKVTPKERLNLCSTTVPFRRSLKGVVYSVVPKLTGYTANSNSVKKISNTYVNHVKRDDTSSLANTLDISSDGGKINNIQARTTLDINGNLTLGQLVAYMMFGSNKSLSSNHYLSPEQKQLMKIEELATEIVPIVNRQSFAKNEFVGNHNNAPLWYQDLYKDEF